MKPICELRVTGRERGGMGGRRGVERGKGQGEMGEGGGEMQMEVGVGDSVGIGGREGVTLGAEASPFIFGSALTPK